MKYVEAIDLGNAPEIYLSGVSQVEQIGPGTVRFTFYSAREDGNVAVLHTIWDIEGFFGITKILEDAIGLLRYSATTVKNRRNRLAIASNN